jgi:hypothetical protein
MARLFSSLLLFLALSPMPSQAALIFSGPGLAPCGPNQCVDVSWTWEESPVGPTGSSPLVLPMPDPEQWVLSSGTMSSSGDGSFYALFHTEDVPGWGGSVVYHFEGLGSDGALLIERSLPLTAVCREDHSQPTITCGDGNGMSEGIPIYYATANDPSFQGPLTIRYDFSRNLYAEPISDYSRFYWSGGVHLVYTAVPEPSTGLLVIAGLLGLAVQRRGHA